MEGTDGWTDGRDGECTELCSASAPCVENMEDHLRRRNKAVEGWMVMVAQTNGHSSVGMRHVAYSRGRQG